MWSPKGELYFWAPLVLCLEGHKAVERWLVSELVLRNNQVLLEDKRKTDRAC